MLLHIVKKEVFSHITSLRFLSMLVLAVVLMAGSGFVFVSEYSGRLEGYRANVNRTLERMRRACKRLGILVNNTWPLYRAPRKLGFCASKGEDELPDRAVIRAFRVWDLSKEPKPTGIVGRDVRLDWAFVVGAILSLAAGLLSYDSISGERERGTLSLALSNPLPRHTVLLAKYIGAMVALMVPVIIGVSLCLLIVNSSIPLTGGDWVRVGFVVLCSLMYLSVFVLLGMFLSVREESTTSVVLFLFFWVALAIVIPNLEGLVAERIKPIPSPAQMASMTKARIEPLDRKLSKYQSVIWKYIDKLKDWEKVEPLAEAVRGYVPVSIRKVGILDEMFAQYFRYMVAQVEAVRTISRISPTSVYRYACESLAGTGLPHLKEFFRQVRRYREEFLKFILDQDMADEESKHMVDPYGSQELFSSKPVNFEDIPKFTDREPSPSEALRSALWDVALLAIFNVVLFMLTFASFLRSDVTPGGGR